MKWDVFTVSDHWSVIYHVHTHSYFSFYKFIFSFCNFNSFLFLKYTLWLRIFYFDFFFGFFKFFFSLLVRTRRLRRRRRCRRLRCSPNYDFAPTWNLSSNSYGSPSFLYCWSCITWTDRRNHPPPIREEDIRSNEKRKKSRESKSLFCFLCRLWSEKRKKPFSSWTGGGSAVIWDCSTGHVVTRFRHSQKNKNKLQIRWILPMVHGPRRPSVTNSGKQWNNETIEQSNNETPSPLHEEEIKRATCDILFLKFKNTNCTMKIIRRFSNFFVNFVGHLATMNNIKKKT